MIHEFTKSDIQKNLLSEDSVFVFYPFDIQVGDELKTKMISGKFALYKIEEIKPLTEFGSSKQAKVNRKNVYRLKLSKQFKYI